VRETVARKSGGFFRCWEQSGDKTGITNDEALVIVIYRSDFVISPQLRKPFAFPEIEPECSGTKGAQL